MSEKTIKPVNLTRIILEYDNGTMLVVPEDKTLKVGTAFMKTIKQEQLEWQVLKLKKTSLKDRLASFFKL